MSDKRPTVAVIDNRDSFVYNLTDALRAYDVHVFRNTVNVDAVLETQPDVLCLSPGPGHPREAGNLMEFVEHAAGRIPLLGICLGFQALCEHFGGDVERCGPVHGQSIPMQLTEEETASELFAGLGTDADPAAVPVARYHSLGCRKLPEPLRPLATTETAIGPVAMAADNAEGTILGLQFHPESILSPTGPLILERCIARLSPD
ncbi:glutamine amidotransferase-related protein [Corynebacterium confusum]|uniref:glutamine amidotransferase-related protein n=1 Tax=uncultured Corynebacterium sp. TaxID=159447 RepID=UPI0025D986B3|nr:gamma-glutamyl-gamma-aminobutyrate hydrolase family protein [uncultured Corynebacterium sp.]